MTLTLQDKRFYSRLAFFLLFVFAPILDIFRLDLTLGHFILFGQNWTLGLEQFQKGEIGPAAAAFNLLWRGFLPLAVLVGVFIWVSWRYGRLYCGWLCPHFSVVEYINGLMIRASGKPSIWERKPLPEKQPDGRTQKPNRRYWPLALLAVVVFAFLWALSLLTYLLPPKEIYHNLLTGSLSRNQTVFLSVGTLAFTIEFLFARHLFCRYGCAVGLFQSLAWMSNKKAMVVSFDGGRAKSCIDCNAACDNACPMRIKPRAIKRQMFTCTQCARCITACEQVQQDNPEGSLLRWLDGECARYTSERDFGYHPDIPSDCFKNNVKTLEYVSAKSLKGTD